MNYLRQFGIIACVTLLGEGLRAALPLPVPASVYGLVIMLLLLCSGLIKVEQVRVCALFLIEMMPLMFLPAVVRVAQEWTVLKPVLLPFFICVAPCTAVVMGVTGRVAQRAMALEGAAPDA